MTADQLEHYALFLTEHGYIAQAVSSDLIQIAFDIKNRHIVVECKLSEYFPYVFPTIHITKESLDECCGIPHKYTDHSLCLFNQADAKPNFLAPQQLLLATVARAYKVLDQGITGENAEDFQEELSEYWSTNTTREIRCFTDFLDNISCFAVTYIQEYSSSGYYLVSSSHSEVEKLRDKVHLDKSTWKQIQYGIFIPLSSAISISDVNTEKQMWSAIAARTTQQQRKHIEAEFVRIGSKNSNIIIISVPTVANKRVLLGWLISDIGRINGFRSGHVSPFTFWAMKPLKKESKIKKIKITTCSQSRLFSRGSYGYDHSFRSSTIIGCGSVGSHLAELLCSMGTESLMLMDDDNLEIENVARHVCGYSDIGLPKAWATKFRIERHNPNVTCEDISGNAFKEIPAKLKSINDKEILFVAVGELPLEAYIMKIASTGDIHIPIAITWVEPHGYAAHMVYIEQIKGAFEALIDTTTMTYRDSVIENTAQFILHDPGCQSGYIPYSGLDVQQYLSRCLHELSQIRANKSIAGNYHFIWIGELSEARRMHVPICKAYEKTPDFTLITKRFD